MSTSTTTTPYPVRIEGHLDPQLSRWKWLFKWLLLIPHFVVLVFLWIAMVVLTVVAFFAILFTGRYPRGIFDFNVGVLRWTWRVEFYGYSANGTDRYPPFTLAETDYPANLTIDYPQQLSRGLALVKWWLLAIPHYIIVAIFSGGGVWLAWNQGGDAARWGGGLIGVLVLISAIALLFTSRYPRSLFDFIMGMNRWTLRVAGYAGLMTDQYPPFRLDMGSTEPGTPTSALLAQSPPSPATPAHPSRGWSAGRVVLLIVGSLVALLAAGLMAGGTAAVVADQTERDASGFLMSPSRHFTSTNYAIVSETIRLNADGPDWLYADNLLGTVQLKTTSNSNVFIGIARAEDVQRYLGNVPRDQVRDIARHRTAYEFRAGTATPAAPAAQTFWAATATGSGARNLRWDVTDGNWQVVAMNADASRNVDTRIAVGAEVPHLLAIAIGVIVGGAALLSIGGLLIYLGARNHTGRPRPSGATPVPV